MINTLSNILPNGTDRVLMGLGGCIGAAFSFAFGDVKPLILWLCIFVTADMVAGMLAALRNDTWSSTKIFLGEYPKSNNVWDYRHGSWF